MERMTKQRRAILECFEKRGHPLSVEEIENEVSTCVQGVSLSTIYRNLKVLIQLGKIQTVHLPGSSEPRYELVHLHHRHHFLCKTCDKLYEIQGCPEGILSMVPKGFKMLEHSITLKGLCKECATA